MKKDVKLKSFQTKLVKKKDCNDSSYVNLVKNSDESNSDEAIEFHGFKKVFYCCPCIIKTNIRKGDSKCNYNYYFCNIK